jgi:hypothetical protein
VSELLVGEHKGIRLLALGYLVSNRNGTNYFRLTSSSLEHLTLP